MTMIASQITSLTVVYSNNNWQVHLYTSAMSRSPRWTLTTNNPMPLQWRHNGCDSVSNYLPHDCLLNRLFRRRSKKTSKLRVTGLCEGNSPGTDEFPAQMASNAENVFIWWRHHGLPCNILPFIVHEAKAQVTLCRSGGPDLYDLKNRGHRHGRLMKSWQHRSNILEVRTIGKRSAMIGKPVPVRQSFTVKLVVLVVTVATIYSWIDFSRVWNRKRRGTVVASVWAFVDSVWAFVDSVWMAVKVGSI